MTQPEASIFLSLDKTTYAPGETMTATVEYTVPEESHVELAAVLRFLGGQINSVPTIVPVAELLLDDDDSARIWEMISNDGTTAVFTAQA